MYLQVEKLSDFWPVVFYLITNMKKETETLQQYNIEHGEHKPDDTGR